MSFDFSKFDFSQFKSNPNPQVPINDETNNLIQNATTMLKSPELQNVYNCDEECQRNKRTKSLFQDLENAKANKRDAPNELNEAERNYYTFTKGGAWFQNFKEDEEKEKANQLIRYLRKDFDEDIHKTNLLLDNYREKIKNQLHINELHKQYKTKYLNTKKQIDILENERNISNRKSKYETEDMTFYKALQSYSFWFTLVVFLSYIIYVIGIKKYRNKKQYIFISFSLLLILSMTYISFYFVRYYKGLFTYKPNYYQLQH